MPQNTLEMKDSGQAGMALKTKIRFISGPSNGDAPANPVLGSGEDEQGNKLSAIYASSTKLVSSRMADKSDSHLTLAGSRSHGVKDYDEFVERLKMIYEKVDLITQAVH